MDETTISPFSEPFAITKKNNSNTHQSTDTAKINNEGTADSKKKLKSPSSNDSQSINRSNQPPNTSRFTQIKKKTKIPFS
uniref:Putative ovule protein n=1 Tax=Solanum chacoense TaxID=4108 RepID=A0A0V0H6B5_SOLCH